MDRKMQRSYLLKQNRHPLFIGKVMTKAAKKAINSETSKGLR